VPFGDCGLNYVFEQPTYSDNSNVVALVDSFGTHYSGEFFPPWATTTPCSNRVNDPDNNTSTCTSTVIVIKEELPNFSYPAADFLHQCRFRAS
jgi:hypothetical protein